jgi:hypothetical protein
MTDNIRFDICSDKLHEENIYNTIIMEMKKKKCKVRERQFLLIRGDGAEFDLFFSDIHFINFFVK